MQKFILLLLSFFIIIIPLSGQEYCGTVISKEESTKLESVMSSTYANRVAKTVPVQIPVKFHSFRRDDGTGGITEAQKDKLIVQINDFYLNSAISFFHQGEINYIDNSSIYDFDASNEGLATVGNNVSKTINIYFFGSIRSNNSGLCGYTRFPPSADHIFVAYGCVLNGNTTLEHELGHYFTLYHTHGTTNTGTTDELVNQSNCKSAGDRLCDTPADPNLSGKVDNNCNYIGNDRDANNELYKPEPANVMAYSRDQCQDLFTLEQYDRIRSGFELGRGYLNFQTENFLATFSSDQTEGCLNNEINFSGNSFGATSWEWTFEGGIPATSNIKNPTVKYEMGGNFNVSLKVFNNVGEEYEVVRNDYITIFNPLESALESDFIADFKNNETAFMFLETKNPDEAFTFEFQNIMIDGNSEGVLKVDNFSYLSENLPNIDDLISEYFDNEGVASYEISFDYAYAYKYGGDLGGAIDLNIYDSLELQLETKCGDVDFQTVFKSGGKELATVPGVSTEYQPISNSEFKNISYTYTPSSEEEFIRFHLKNKSYNGNNIFFKNLKIIIDFSLVKPADFRFTSADNSSVQLRWLDKANNETGYTLERSIGTQDDFTEIVTLPANAQSYLDEFENIDQDIFYRLKAIGKPGYESVYTNVIHVSSSILSINDFLENSFLVYPNPVKNHLFIENNSNLAFDNYQIHSVDGKLMDKGIIKANTKLDLSDYPAGTFFVEFYSELLNKVIVKRIIKF